MDTHSYVVAISFYERLAVVYADREKELRDGKYACSVSWCYADDYHPDDLRHTTEIYRTKSRRK